MKPYYRVCEVNSQEYYDWQYGKEVIKGKYDGYAGSPGKAIDMFQIRPCKPDSQNTRSFSILSFLEEDESKFKCIYSDSFKFYPKFNYSFCNI